MPVITLVTIAFLVTFCDFTAEVTLVHYWQNHDEDLALLTNVTSEILASLPPCVLMVHHHYPALTPDLEVLLRNHPHPSMSFAAVRKDPSLDESSEVNATSSMRALIWPSVKDAPNIVGMCVFRLVIFDAESFDLVMKEVSSKVAVQPSVDYFLFWNSSGDVRPALLSSCGQVLRYKLGAITTSNDINTSRLTLVSVCFFCDHGEPEVVTILDHYDYQNEFRPQLLFPDFARNMHGKFMNGVFIYEMSKEILRRRRSIEETELVLESILELLGVCLNFDWEVKKMEAGAAAAVESRLEDGTWLGMTGEITYGRADFAPGFLMTPTSLEAIDLSVPYVIDRITFMTAQPKQIFSWTVIIDPYTSGGWAFIISSVILASAVLYCLLRAQARLDEPFLEITPSEYVPYSLQFMSLALIGWGPTAIPTRSSTQSFIGMWLLVAIIISCLYQSKMVEFMTSPKMEVLPTTWDELVISKLRWGSSYTHKIYFQMLTEEVDVESLIYVVANMEGQSTLRECLQETQVRPYACISTKMYLSWTAESFFKSDGESKVLLAPTDSMNIYCSYALTKHHVSRLVLNTHLQRLFNAGLVKHFTDRLMYWVKWNGMKQARKRNEKEEVPGPQPLMWKQLEVSFLCLGIGLGTGLVAFGIEVVKHLGVLVTRKGRNRPAKKHLIITVAQRNSAR